jgi:anti-sigma B factor antagonist
MGQQAVMTFPEHIDVSNAGQIREELLAVIDRGAATLIVDMTETVSSGRAVANVIMRACQSAMANRTELRLVVTAQIIRRVLSADGLDRLISIYPSLETATAAPAAVIPPVPRPAKTKAGGRCTSWPWSRRLRPVAAVDAGGRLRRWSGADRRRWRPRPGQPAAGGAVRAAVICGCWGR